MEGKKRAIIKTANRAVRDGVTLRRNLIVSRNHDCLVILLHVRSLLPVKHAASAAAAAVVVVMMLLRGHLLPGSRYVVRK